MEESIAIEWLRAILLLGIAVVVWVIIRLKHQHADVSLRWLEGIAESYTISAFFWGGIVGLAVIAANYNVNWVLRLTLLMLFTKFFGVLTYIEVSTTIMSLFWGLEKQSNGRLDYRTYVVVAMAVFPVYLVALYLYNGLLENPVTFP